MGKISEIFNFDNIGGKIKNLAKWSCWITILLIWIAAPIAFITLVADDWTAYLCWIPLVGAIVGPIFVWLGSWAMYAFGEFVEDIHAIRNKEGTTDEKAKREAKEKAIREAKEKAIREAKDQTSSENQQDFYDEEASIKLQEECEDNFETIKEKGKKLAEAEIKEKNGVLKDYWGKDEYIIIPSNITEIGKDSFEFSHNLKGVVMHNGITKIGTYAFNGCHNLSTVILSNCIKTLDCGVFSGCGKLYSILIPNSVTHISEEAFENCGKFIIHTTAGSYAEEFAKENGLEIELI